MDPVQNPYEPGAGRRPPELAGRAEIIEDMKILIARCEAGRGDRGRILHGLRGVGKTVLLNEFYAMAQARHWIVAKVEGSPARPGIARFIAQGLHRSLREATGRHDAAPLHRALSVFRSFSLKVDPSGAYSFGLDVTAATGTADSGDLTTDLTDLFIALGETAAEFGIGVMLLIDEMQELTKAEVTALNLAAHEIGQRPTPLPAVIIGAGLPSLPGVLAAATTYAERLYEYRHIGALDPVNAARALSVPAEQKGVQWHPEALKRAVLACEGYPFALQSCGKFVWDYATTSPITLEDTEVGLTYSQEEMFSGIYPARWARATRAERDVMRALAAYGEGATASMADIAAATGKPRQSLSKPRDQLIKKGLVHAPDRGVVAFSIAGMAWFIQRQPD